MKESLKDKVLDRSIVGGYTNLGPLLRRGRWADDPAPGSLVGKRALVTGAGSGLGEATVLGLARLGATVHLLGRAAERVEPAVRRVAERLEQEGHVPDLHVEVCDVSDLKAVRRFAKGFNARRAEEYGALDVLVHNAGTLPATRQTSVDGHELTLATHVLGPFLLTELLAPSLAESAEGGRVVLVSSGGMYTQPLPVDDPEYLRGDYRGPVAYARSKRVQVELAPLLAGRLADARVAVHAMHPGWADTPGVASSLPLFRALTRPLLRSSEQGADTTVWLAATQPPPPSGLFWHDRVARPTSYRAATAPSDEERRAMWEWVLDAAGLPDR
ncbi:SDR family NAD(P)-dependent oxidoreductase [Nocardioides stalactiti]|uniref:SDR family NAD(P)-dependent oxidoreductase n=1 Tax=Nocardioides stalactiti TaxID=2755356 RepID=UPI001603A202|nr:SDR family NAD(P)-dependent oxidoreductase [Nocardioides stalactiti]